MLKTVQNIWRSLIEQGFACQTWGGGCSPGKCILLLGRHREIPTLIGTKLNSTLTGAHSGTTLENPTLCGAEIGQNDGTFAVLAYSYCRKCECTYLSICAKSLSVTAYRLFLGFNLDRVCPEWWWRDGPAIWVYTLEEEQIGASQPPGLIFYCHGQSVDAVSAGNTSRF